MLNYILGILIHTSSKDQLKRALLWIGVVINISVLIYFKYYNFILNDILHVLTHVPKLEPNQEVHLPLGISFFTFHGLTYITDIYRRDARVSQNPLNVGLYILFFPQLIAGPIVRYKDIDQQLKSRSITEQKIYDGTKRFIIGLSKKILIANTLGNVADQIFALEHKDVSSSLTWFALICYSLQIYFDFSGYSDMAIGLAKLFGFEFLENFNFPYSARSIKDFWRRWHISLSTFFRDYVYIPMGGNKVGLTRTYINLLIVFFLTGLWHGASWNFILWGIIHGLFIILERAGFDKMLQRLPTVIAHGYTLFVVVIAWLFFRIENMGDINFYLQKLFFVDQYSSGAYYPAYYLRTNVLMSLLLGLIFCFPLHSYFTFFKHYSFRLVGEISYILLFILCIMNLSASTYNPFIYFRF